MKNVCEHCSEEIVIGGRAIQCLHRVYCSRDCLNLDIDLFSRPIKIPPAIDSGLVPTTEDKAKWWYERMTTVEAPETVTDFIKGCTVGFGDGFKKALELHGIDYDWLKEEGI